MIKKLIPSSLKQRIRMTLYSGDKYICPICGFKSKDFFPTGFDIPVIRQKEIIGAGRRNAGCYKCGSNDRERLIYTYLSEKLNLFKESKDLKILHLAPEKNLSKALLSSGFTHYVCGDLFTEGYSYPDYVQNMNVLDIPYEDNYFDVIICNHLLEHVPDDIKAMKELYRVLARGGKAILQVPISKNSEETFEDFSIADPKEREAVFGQFDHVRIYGQDYVQRLTSAGFTVERTNISEEFPKYGLLNDEDIFIGHK
ncbi:class I SAM-dependent methyltransferase [Flagellimonas sp.]|uniref:class I SAM-dependent methyltransferase n=1 Tax=Flagellimonas sp. TaxID=2058762 RepID=UPI003F4A2F9E